MESRFTPAQDTINNQFTFTALPLEATATAAAAAALLASAASSLLARDNLDRILLGLMAPGRSARTMRGTASHSLVLPSEMLLGVMLQKIGPYTHLYWFVFIRTHVAPVESLEDRQGPL